MDKNELLLFLDECKINSDEVRELYRVMKRNEHLSRYKFPETPCKSDGCYHIHVADAHKKSGRKDVKAKTLEELKEKVYQHDCGIDGTERRTFQEVFLIMEERKPTLARDSGEAESVRNSVRREKNTFHNYFEGTSLALMFVDEIRKRDIEMFAEMTLKSREVLPKAYLAIRGIIRQTLEFAYKQEWINENPHFRADYKQFNRLLIEPAEIEDRVHTTDEIARMKAYLKARHEEKPIFIPAYALEFQMMIGAREGEIPPLRWQDVENGYVYIRREQIVVKKTEANGSSVVMLNHTKTRRNRKYPMTEEVSEFLARLKAVYERFDIRSEYLFPSRRDVSKPLHNNSIYREYKRMCTALEIRINPQAKKGPHSYRRVAITQTVNNSGGDIVMAAKLFGNSPNVIDQHYYTGLDLGYAKRILEM